MRDRGQDVSGRFIAVVGLIAAVAGAGYWYVEKGQGPMVSSSASAPASTPGLPVVIGTVKVQPVPEILSTIGTVQPMASVAIRARVDSVIREVHFTEGQEVRKGDLLFTLDSRSQEAALAQAQANLERDQANLEKARRDVQRYAALVRTNTVARQQYDAAVADAAALEATVKADQAAISAAQVLLSYTRIHAPMDGRTGTVTAKPGSSVRGGEAGALVTLTQLRPVFVVFSAAERYLPNLRAAMAAGEAPALARSGGVTAEGALVFIDSQVDAQTGTILAKAQFPNEDTRLWPGQFVDVGVTLKIDQTALTIPQAAVQIGQNFQFVYVAKTDNTVELRKVTVGRVEGGVAVVTSGLEAGERIVIDGQSRLYPGARIREAANATSPANDRAVPGTNSGNGSAAS